MKTVKVTKAQAVALADRTTDAYSVGRYNSWNAVAKVLLQQGYTPLAAEVILRSKITRWAADNSKADYGRTPAHDLLSYLKRHPGDVKRVLREKGLTSPMIQPTSPTGYQCRCLRCGESFTLKGSDTIRHQCLPEYA
jgi:hypothetical protein